MEDQQTTDFSLPEEFENQNAFGRLNTWIKNHSRALTSLIIIAVIVGVGIYAYNRPKVEEGVAPSTDQPLVNEEVKGEENTQPLVEIVQPTESATQPTTPTVAVVKPVERTVEMKSEEIVVTAGKGDGVTHLARQALREYMKADAGIQLNAEQKIYVEDFMKDKTSNTRLAMGESKNFSKDTIKQAIDAAKNLNETQIQNLSKYTKLVPELS